MNKIILATVCIMFIVVYALDAQLSFAGKSPESVMICHIPPDDPTNFHTITVSEESVPAHLAHHDILGSCDNIECPCYGETELNEWYITLSGCQGYNLICEDIPHIGFTSVFSGACTSGEHVRSLYLLYIPYSPGGTFCEINIPEDQIYFRDYLTDDQIKACRLILLNSNSWSLCPQ